MIKHTMQRNASLLLGGAGVLAALLSAGCGGGSTAKSSATPAGPAAYGLGTASSAGAGLEVSGLGLLANPANPGAASTSTTTGDVPYITSATAVTPLNGAPAPLAGTTDIVGVSYVYADGTAATPAPAGQAGVTFRAEVANGQNSSGGLIAIQSVVLSSTDPEWTLGTLPLTVQYNVASAAGPFSLATESTSPFTLPFTTSGPHTVSVTVTDTAGQSTRTDYDIQVQAATDIAVGINTIDTGTVDADGAAVIYTLQPGDTATITGGPGTLGTGTADANGIALLYSTPGTQTLTVNGTDAAGAAVTYTQTIDLTTVAPGGTYSQIKRHALVKRH